MIHNWSAEKIDLDEKHWSEVKFVPKDLSNKVKQYQTVIIIVRNDGHLTRKTETWENQQPRFRQMGLSHPFMWWQLEDDFERNMN